MFYIGLLAVFIGSRLDIFGLRMSSANLNAKVNSFFFLAGVHLKQALIRIRSITV